MSCKSAYAMVIYRLLLSMSFDLLIVEVQNLQQCVQMVGAAYDGRRRRRRRRYCNCN
jgi:hypothetical protein